MKRFTFYLFAMLFLCNCMVSDGQEMVDQIDTQFQGVKSIHIKGVFCDVRVEPSNSSEVTLQGEIRSVRNSDQYGIETALRGDELEIWVEHPKRMIGHVKGFLALEAPKDVVLKVSNVSGNVKVENIASDNIMLKSVSGNVFVTGAGKDAEVKSVSGNVEALVINGGLSTSTVSGKQLISNVKGSLSSQSTSGNISAKMIEGETTAKSTSGSLVFENLMNGASLKTTSGDIKLSVLRGHLNAKTVSGDITLADVTGELNIKSTSGSQRGDKIMLTASSYFSSVSGDITMNLDNQIDALGFDLRSGSGRLSAGESQSDKKLKISRGDIMVTGSTTSGNQIFR